MKGTSKKTKVVVETEFKDALVKKALGYDATEIVEEYVSSDEGEVKLTKKKVTKKQKENKIKKVFNNKDTIFQFLKKSYVDKFVLSLGFDLGDCIANSYINDSLNTIICMYIEYNRV